MTIQSFTLPDLGEGLGEAEITAWFVHQGDLVVLNQPLCSVETAKAEVEVPSPFVGTVVARHGEVGDVVGVGSVLVEIEAAIPAASGPVPEREDERAPVLVGYGAAVGSTPRRRRRSTVATAGASSPARPSWGAQPAAPRPLAKPPVRLLARRLGVDLEAVVPTGPHGSISRADVERAADPRPADAFGETGPGPRPGETVPLRGIRRTTADVMTRSHREIPAASASVWTDFSALLDARRALQHAATASGRSAVVTPFSLLCRLVVEALRAAPILNATFDGDGGAIHVHRAIHLGFAAATDRGLVVPVVRDAHDRSVDDLASEIRRLADAARDGRTTPGELQGSTFTVSNFGSFGLDDGNPMINHPEAAILGVGAIKERPWVIDGALAVRQTAKLTCTFDHRVADGAAAGAFLTALRRLVEAPTALMLDV